MKKFISVMLSLTMIFSAFGVVNTNASNLQNMYYAYKYLIDSACAEERRVSSRIDERYYDLYDIDKDGSAELFIYTYRWDYNDPFGYSYVSVYTYKNGQAYLCGKLGGPYEGSCYDFEALCENRYGNGVGISVSLDLDHRYKFYVLNGTELVSTGNCYVHTEGFDNLSPVYAYNDDRISENTANTYFARRGNSKNSVNNLTYLKKYFKM